MRRCEDLEVCETAQEFLQRLPPCPSCCKGKQAKHKYIDVTACFDTETTNTQETGFIWSYQINVGGLNAVVRTYPQFIAILQGIVTAWGINTGKRLKIHVHNLGYETYYLAQLLQESFGVKSIMFTSSHKVLSMKLENGIEFYDSLKLFQKSLAGATKGCPHEKAVGDLDYKAYHDARTPLTDTEYKYIVYDVQGLWEAIERLKADGGYNAATLPITNTARVLKAVNNKVHKAKGWNALMHKLALPPDCLKLAYKCMAGGDTHGNRYKMGKTYRNCNSYDFKSAHPSQMLTKKYPMSSPQYIGDCTEDDLWTLIDGGYGWIGHVAMTNVKVLHDNPDPTISKSKCSYIESPIRADNGRVLSTPGMAVYMDSNDWQRFTEGYDWDDTLATDVWAFRLDYLPSAFRSAVKGYFEQKESLPKDTPDYIFAKICVNTIFGACAQKTVRDEYEYSIDELLEVTKTGWESKIDSMTEKQVLASQTKPSKLPFLWGLWTASCSRLELWHLIKAVGWDKAIYWDTDSCKYIGDRPAAVEDYNRAQRELVRERDAIVINRKGQESYIGVAEDEHPDNDYGYQEFRALHAKCYAYRDADGELQVTIAGVSKEEGRKALCDNINLLQDGFSINPAGGNKLWYHPAPVYWSDTDTPTASWIYMEDRDYKVRYTDLITAIESMEIWEGEQNLAG